jgi:hypothetical protein
VIPGVDAEIDIEPEVVDKSKNDHDNMPTSSEDNPIGIEPDGSGTANDDTNEFEPMTDETPMEAIVSPTPSSKSPKAKMKQSSKPDVSLLCFVPYTRHQHYTMGPGRNTNLTDFCRG